VATLYTIGHSTRTLAEFLETLQAHRIRTLVDIRAFPVSRRMPHFSRDSLKLSLNEQQIEYVWMQALGGYRKKTLADSPNLGLRNASFRNYADHMLSAEFESAMAELLRISGQSATAYMCAERMYFSCHRMLVSDWLVAHGHEVLHIDGTGPMKPHKLTPEARLIKGKLIYRGDRLPGI
jgi:uncharacterized protein (DUF488 family)